ncbi:MAG: phosphoglucosamine mutase [Alphaproteobacteria bacterium]|nr:phosphoglucosamine mutase [Alphaproteobacteria bacterium]
MTRSIFGTDGVRGQANTHPMTAEIAMKLGQAAGRRFQRGGLRHRAVIGKDTRLSGYMIESALQAGLTSAGMDVFLLGPVPTPAVGMLTRSMRADLGVMISASHNPYQDNGIKLFGPDGFKLSDAEEAEIEALMGRAPTHAAPDQIGRAKRVEGGAARYVEFAKATFPKHLRLDGLKIVIDCANGAAYQTAPDVLWELGADIVKIGVSPNGANINAGCGSTAPEACQRAVVEHGAHLGVALDGDADRVHVIDETGRIVDGDQLMALIAGRWAAAGRLSGGALVATVMSNLGLERWLAARGVGLERTRVGDRYVVEKMRAGGYNVGGEQSGHIILSDFTTTGDGLIAALQALAALIEDGRPASQALRLFEPLPQVLRSVRYDRAARPLEDAGVVRVIAAAEARLNGAGRLVIRASGTEPVIRVMAEGEDAAIVEATVGAVCEAVGKAACAAAR